MAKKLFEVEIRNNGPKGYETAVSLRMPATWSEFHDALQKARIKDGRSCGNELLYVGYDGLQRGMIGRSVNLYDLKAAGRIDPGGKRRDGDSAGNGVEPSQGSCLPGAPYQPDLQY